MTPSLGLHHIYLSLPLSRAGHYSWQWRQTITWELGKWRFQSARSSPEIVFFFPTSQLHDRLRGNYKYSKDVFTFASGGMWRAFKCRWKSSSSRCPQVELAHSNTWCFTGSLFFCPLKPYVFHCVPPLLLNIGYTNKHAERSCFTVALSAFQSVLWVCCVSRVWEICEGALSTHSPPPSGSSSSAGDTHLLYGILLSLPLSVSMASTIKRFSSDCQHLKNPSPTSNTAGTARIDFIPHTLFFSVQSKDTPWK